MQQITEVSPVIPRNRGGSVLFTFPIKSMYLDVYSSVARKKNEESTILSLLFSPPAINIQSSSFLNGGSTFQETKLGCKDGLFRQF
ncbi:unnamed protein product [Acanthoscelides obtectus]|uniref:Uncharacterized protein n=1 Tax=Acanthoscelides obtectus TaxID=200917 RepID=A0A9P0K385_ACAOB|nr:unnamed protein product [Acanthoscelides obtectus]CAK1627497.1 hypothetical protein AOBTE_LOCUS4632 [Acanthoscelides obtectus]